MGRSSGHYFAWDGIRAIDYLLTRPEVDAQRIGITGISGGGTQTAYISALDERLAAAAPTCYITSMHLLLESLGPQDGEQNLLGGVLAGLDHADYLAVQAPRPILVMANTRDYFSIQGARETCTEVARAYAALGAPSAFRKEEDDAPHGFTPVSRSFIYAFFQQSLNLPGDPREEPVEPLPLADLTVTPSGQLATSLGGETIFSLNRAAADALAEALDQRRGALEEHRATVRETATRLAGYRSPPASAPCFVGRHRQEGYNIEKVVLQGTDGTILPSLVLVPAGSGRFPAAVWLDAAGKGAAVAPSGTAVALARRGWVVLLPDLSLVGELATAAGDWTFEPALLGRSWPGMRAGEIGQALAYLRARDDVRAGAIAALASGALGPALLHAALVDPSLRPLVLFNSLFSWQDVVRERMATTEFAAIVPGALAAYDLPDLAACLAPRPLLVLNPRNALGEPADAQQVQAAWAVARQAYRT